jgi:hypothetical protein
LFPTFDYSGISEEDEMWRAEGRETEDEIVERTGKGVRDVLELAGEETCECFDPIHMAG